MDKKSDLTLEAAKLRDQSDPLKGFRDEFCFPCDSKGRPLLYFAGHSLGLCPKQAASFVQEELDAWARFGVRGHFSAKHPWFSYHELVTSALANLVGAKEREVVAMNGLTANLHFMLVSFYRPTSKRYKILIENNTFPSDSYAVASQARFHGFCPKKAIVELRPDDNKITISPERVLQTIADHGDSLALVMLGNCNYLSGQAFATKAIVEKAKSVGAMVGFNLAHGVGNLHLKLHQWGPDFAVWCSYKYLNGGPGGIAGAFVHERHLKGEDIPRFEGWWGADKKTRFAMGPLFEGINSAEAWQLSNPPIFQLAALRASLEIFERATIKALVEKRDRLTGYLEELLSAKCKERCSVITPPQRPGEQARGGMLCVRFHPGFEEIGKRLEQKGIIVDFRSPDITRMAMAPLYNNYSDAFHLAQAINES